MNLMGSSQPPWLLAKSRKQGAQQYKLVSNPDLPLANRTFIICHTRLSCSWYYAITIRRKSREMQWGKHCLVIVGEGSKCVCTNCKCAKGECLPKCDKNCCGGSEQCASKCGSKFSVSDKLYFNNYHNIIMKYLFKVSVIWRTAFRPRRDRQDSQTR